MCKQKGGGQVEFDLVLFLASRRVVDNGQDSLWIETFWRSRHSSLFLAREEDHGLSVRLAQQINNSEWNKEKINVKRIDVTRLVPVRM